MKVITAKNPIKTPTLALLTSAATLFGVASAAAEEPPPNILFIFAEDMGLDINPYMEVPFATPGLDRMAREGVVFENAWVTQASCSPSRASVFTGLYPHQHGQIGLQRRGSQTHEGTPTFIEALRDLNYYTGVTYKLHFAGAPEFDVGPANTAWGDPVQLADVAKRVIDTATEQNRPWFMMVNTFDTHAVDRNIAYRNENLFRHVFAGLPEDPLTVDDVGIPPYFYDSEDFEIHPNFHDNMAAYYNSVRRVDYTVELLLNALDERGLRDNTIIIFSSDHGPPIPRGKQMTYNVSMHVPFIMIAPEAEPGTRRSEFISLVDLKPTFHDYSGAEMPELESDARSIRRTLLNEVEPREVLAGQFFLHWGPIGFFPSYTIRTEDYKLIYNARHDIRRNWREYGRIPFLDAIPDITDEAFSNAFRQSMSPPRYQLYDMHNDFWEFHNLADRPEYQETLQDMVAKLEAWRKDQNDPFLDSTVMDELVRLVMEARRATDGVEREVQLDVMERKGNMVSELMRTRQPAGSLLDN